MSQLKILLGRRIREIRRARNLTQEKLSELVNIGASSICKIENGIYHPSDDNLEKIAQALKVEPYELYMCGHCKSVDEQRQELSSMLQQAKDDTVRFMYKVLK